MITTQVKSRYLDMLKTALGQTILDLMDDDKVIEVMLNPDGQLIVDRLNEGKSFAGVTIDAPQAENIVKLVASYKNHVADKQTPMIASDLPILGARFQGWLPPVVKTACFAIRKRATHVFTLDHYIEQGALSPDAAQYLQDAVQKRFNMIIVGGTSSGKTTFANALLHELRKTDDRVLVMEDLPELQVHAPDVVTMTTTPQVNMTDLVKGALRMRPDRIIIGEVRDGAALDLLKAWNTGHPGGLCTLHANSIESAPFRLEDLLQEVVVKASKHLITQAVDLIVHLERDRSGLRKVKAISELTGYHVDGYTFTQIYEAS